MDELVSRALRPIGLRTYAEVVLGTDLGVGDGVPETLRRRSDVDLEHLLHRLLQFALEVGEPSGPRRRVLAHPAVVDELDRDRVEVVRLLASMALRDDETCVFQEPEVLRDADTRHAMAGAQGDERLA